MSKYFVLVGVLLLTAGFASAQEEDFPRVETSPGFMYIRTPISFTVPGFPSFNQSFNCAGAGGTITVNLTSMLGVGADLGGCKYVGETVRPPVSTDISSSAFTFLFGPRLTFRNSSRFVPFTDLQFGGMHVGINCNNNAGDICPGNPSISRTAFAMTVGGGIDIRLTKRISLRPIEADYLYTRFGNGCDLPVCSFNNSQNSFRLKSGIVISWGGAAR